jgi:hypothetical protein
MEITYQIGNYKDTGKKWIRPSDNAVLSIFVFVLDFGTISTASASIRNFDFTPWLEKFTIDPSFLNGLTAYTVDPATNNMATAENSTDTFSWNSTTNRLTCRFPAKRLNFRLYGVVELAVNPVFAPFPAEESYPGEQLTVDNVSIRTTGDIFEILVLRCIDEDPTDLTFTIIDNDDYAADTATFADLDGLDTQAASMLDENQEILGVFPSNNYRNVLDMGYYANFPLPATWGNYKVIARINGADGIKYAVLPLGGISSRLAPYETTLADKPTILAALEALF